MAAKARRIYVYALIPERPARSLGKGMTRALTLIRARDAFVVGEVIDDDDNDDDDDAVLEANAETVMAHDRVVRQIARVCPSILPSRFGMVAKKEAIIDATSRIDLSPLFARVRGCVQFTLRVSGRRMPKIKPNREKANGPGTRWLMDRLASQRVPEIDPITKATHSLVRESTVERRDNDKDDLVAVAYHLVAKRNVRAWTEAMTRAQTKLDKRISVSVTGPWPPYSFAELV